MLPNELLIVDTMNVVRRVYEANPAPESAEKVEHALRSLNGTLRNIEQQYPVTHRAMVMDAPGKNWRHDVYPDYKAGRTPMPQILRDGVNEYLRVLKGRGWPKWEYVGFEADDGIFSLAAAAEKVGLPTLTISTDKDVSAVLQFKGARVRDHFGDIWRDEAWCLAKFGVLPRQLQDLLALTGDPSDGIPGVDKVGVKTAAKWLQAYDTLEGVLAAAPNMTGAIGQRLRDQTDRARLSRQLTEMRRDLIPANFDWDRLKIKTPTV